MASELYGKYEQVILGTDTVWAGNIKPPSGQDHFIADYRVNGEPLPEIYDDPLAEELRQNGAANRPANHEQVAAFVHKYNLLDLAGEVADRAEREHSPGDAGVIRRLMANMRLC